MKNKAKGLYLIKKIRKMIKMGQAALSVDEIISQLEEEATPNSAWKKAKPKVQKGTKYMRTADDYSTETKGQALVERVESYATDLYGAIGESGSGDKQINSHRLRTVLGQDNYINFKAALKKGDIDEANKLIKDAFTGEVEEAKLNHTLERFHALSPDEKIDFGKKTVKKIGGADYVTALTAPQEIYKILKQQKAVADAYKG